MANGLFNLKQVMQAVQQGGWTAQKPPAVEYLVVAGGGGGGSGNTGNGGGGGGAGGLLQGIDSVPNGQEILITVGAAGSGTTAGGTGTTNGGNSVFGNVVAIGGGYGGNGYTGNVVPNSGGSGGGGGAATSASPVSGASGIAGQGNSGGYGSNSVGYNAGGGGGAGSAGINCATGKAGNGGQGVSSIISGTITAYAGGGGGGAYNTALGGTGGVGGGGTGGNNTTGTAGTTNTGGGGGGAGGTASSSNGGSGIVVISYPDTYAAPVATTGSPTVSTSGSGSIAFTSASSQVLVYASNSAFQFGTGDFTWESWVYMSASGSYGFFDLGAINSSGSFGVFTSSSTIYVRIDGGNDLTYTAPGSFFGNWVHLAVVRSGATMTLYYNGVAVATGTRTQNLTQQTPYIGNLNGLNYYLNGNISNMRVVKGTAVYTGNFTPSTTPLRVVSGTSLLLNSVSGAYLADSSTNSFATTTGTVAPSWNASSPFTVTGYKNRVYTWTSSGSITF